MKTQLKNLMFALSLVTTPILMAEAPATTEQTDVSSFLDTLKSEIKKQQDLVTKAKEQIERTDIVPPAAILNQFENAYIMLNVKQTLYANFAGTPSIQSPLVREKLLQIFKKDIITPGDLSELEALVKQERPKYVTPSTDNSAGK